MSDAPAWRDPYAPPDPMVNWISPDHLPWLDLQQAYEAARRAVRALAEAAEAERIALHGKSK